MPTRATFFAQKHAVMHSFSCSFEMKAKIQHPQSLPPKRCILRCILHQNPGVAPHKIANSQGHGKVVIYAQASRAVRQVLFKRVSITITATPKWPVHTTDHHSIRLSILKTTWSQESHLSSKPVLGRYLSPGQFLRGRTAQPAEPSRPPPGAY